MIFRSFKTVSVLFFLIFISSSLCEASIEWLDDFELAKQKASQSGKFILANFTGSDWCSYCIRAEEEIFSKPILEEFVADKFIPLKIDFPKKTKLSKDKESINNALANRYAVNSFPTHLILDAEGEILAKTGYIRGGAESWISVCEVVLNKVPKPKKVVFNHDVMKTLERAKSKGLPLLMLIFKKGNDIQRATIDMISRDTVFATMNDWGFESVALDEEDVKKEGQFSQMIIKDEEILPEDGPCCVLYDPIVKSVRYKKIITNENKKVLIDELKSRLDFSYRGGWMTDYNRAKLIAENENRFVMMKFTGSDWCSWCKKMEENIFTQKVFKDFAKKKLVLLELDYPIQTRLVPELKEQNEWLSSRYGVNAYPTIIILDKSGKELLKANYYDGSANDFVKDLKAFLSKQ